MSGTPTPVDPFLVEAADAGSAGCTVALTDYLGVHSGRPALVMGGGVSLPDQARSLGDVSGWLLISANEHGCVLRDAGGVPRVDYILAIDHRSRPKVQGLGVPVVSIRRWADIRMFRKPAATSGMCAAWMAWAMGCCPVVLAGMDCYEGGTYWHDTAAESSGATVGTHTHLKHWKQLGSKFDGRLRVMGGPLSKLFPLYDPVEVVEPIRVIDRAEVAGRRVKFLSTVQYDDAVYRPYVRAEMSITEARKLVGHRQAEYI